MALIGTKQWSPLGESMWGITAKLAQLNHLNWIEVRRLFGIRDRKSFASAVQQLPDLASNFHLTALTTSTGWPLESLRPSFSSWYQPPWVNDPEKRHISNSCERLRACPECIAEGTHLIVHQMQDFIACPIHRHPLSLRCPHCKEGLGGFQMAAPATAWGYCMHCDQTIVNCKSRTDASARKRQRFIESYAAWMSELRQTFAADSGSLRWLGPESSISAMAHAHQLVPGPEWVNDCVVNASTMRMSRWNWKGIPIDSGVSMHAYRIPADPMCLLYDRNYKRREPPALAEDCELLLSSGVKEHHQRLVGAFGVSTMHAGVLEWSATECATQFGESVNVWDTGYWLWRRSMDEAFPVRSRWSRRRKYNPMYMSWIWRSWYDALGQLLWSPLETLDRPFNLDFVRWMTPIWLSRKCDESFAQCVGLASRLIGYGLTNMDAISYAMHIVASDAKWVVDRTNRSRTVIRAISSIADIGPFLKLKQSGFKGSDEHYCMSFERLRPLIELLRTHPERIYEWESTWRDVRWRYERRRAARQRTEESGPGGQIDSVLL